MSPGLPPRIRLRLAYDGSPFSGWQSQPDGNAIQDHLGRALAAVAGGPVRVHGSGRTDAGVHALGQVAHFDPPAEARLGPDAWQRALNAHLPATIRVLEASPVPPSFHARFSALGKTYAYHLVCGPVLPPHDHLRAWHLRPRPDVHKLADALGRFVGTHDFRAFAAIRGDGREDEPGYAVRTIARAGIATRMTGSGESETLILEFEGDGFLYKMVRLLTGSAVHVAHGRQPVAWIDSLLHDPAAPKSSHCAPPHGLYLIGPHYPDDLEQNDESIK